jgi:uncharacterized membrane protein YccC
MDVGHNNTESSDEMVGVIASCGLLLHSLLARLGRAAAGFARKVGEIAREDPRRVAHSLKVGLALALVSVVYFVTPLFNGLGAVSTMWAVLTVVVVMEYTVGTSASSYIYDLAIRAMQSVHHLKTYVFSVTGATLSKGLNRGFATLVAGCIAVGAHKLAELAEDFGVQGEPISLTVFVFFIGTLFIRLFSIVSETSSLK